MKKFTKNILLVLLIFSFLLIENLSSGQNNFKTIINSNEKTEESSDINSKSSVISSFSEITPGRWLANAAPGFDLEFVINEDVTSIIEYKLIFDDWVCGSLKRGGSIKITSSWSISNRAFAADITLGYNPTEKFSVNGTFAENGAQASGSWSYKSDYGNCSGSWTATPEGGVSELPDFTVTSLDFNPEKGIEGTVLNVNASVKNNSSALGGESILQFYLSANDVISTSDVKIGEVTLPAISGGLEVDENISWAIPASLAEGLYYVGCIADAENQVDESVESNNKFISDLQFEKIAQGLPELVPVAGGFQPDSGGLGAILNINATIKNTGFAPADTSTVAFYLCVDPDIAVADILIGTAAVSALDTDEETTVELMYEITNNLPPGEYYIGYKSDYFDSVDELDEGIYYYLPNSLFTRLPDPDLAVTSLNFSPAKGKSGENMNVNIVLKNLDDGNSGQSNVNYYLSTDTVVSESDYLIGTSSVANLESNQETEVGINWTIQSDLPDGMYYVGCKADDENQVAESNENNNTFFNYPEQFTKDDPPQIKSLFPSGVITTTIDSKPNFKLVFTEPIQEGEGCMKIYQELNDGSEVLVRDKECWEGKISDDTVTFRLSTCLDSFANHYVLIDEGFVKDLSGNPFEGLSEKSAWTFKTGGFPTGVFEETDIKNARIFPNPTSGGLNIELLNVKAPYVFELITIAGQEVVQKELRATEEQIDLSGLAKGIYLLKVYNSNFSKAEKLIIK